MLFDAHKLNMHKDTNWRNELSTYRKNSLIEEYLQKTVLDSIISENYLLHVYAGLPPEFRYAHPYSKYRQHLYEEALNDKHDAIQYFLSILFEKMILENKLVFNDSVLTQFVRAFKESRDRQLSLNVQDNTLINILNDLRDNYKIVSTKTRSYSSDWFKKEVISRKINFSFRNADSELFKNIFKMLIVEDIIYHKALKSDLDKSKDFINKYNDIKDLPCYHFIHLKRSLILLYLMTILYSTIIFATKILSTWPPPELRFMKFFLKIVCSRSRYLTWPADLGIFTRWRLSTPSVSVIKKNQATLVIFLPINMAGLVRLLKN
jgi:hypothetical protein